MKKYTKTNKDSSKQKNGSHSRLTRLSGPADAIDAICRKKLPDGVIRCGTLAGRESEIRQEAIILTLSGFLDGHPGYRTAKESGNHERIENEMERCVSIALRICKMRMESDLFKEYDRNEPIMEHHMGTCLHPSDWNTSDWPMSARVSVILRAAEHAVKTKKISAKNADLLTKFVSGRTSVEEISEKLHVSQSAIYQQLRKVRDALPEVVGLMELKSMGSESV